MLVFMAADSTILEPSATYIRMESVANIFSIMSFFTLVALTTLGKTNYMLFESIVTNTIYYGIAFLLYSVGVWTPTLRGIALLFGCGIAFDSVVSFGAYVYLLRKEKIHILK